MNLGLNFSLVISVRKFICNLDDCPEDNMPYCKNCGAEYSEGARFCPKCGAPVAGYEREEWKGPRDECFGERRGKRDYLGLVSFGIFLLIVGYIFFTNPWIPSDFFIWIENLGKGVFKPSIGLINVFALFLALIGVSNFIIAGIRVALRQPWRRPLSGTLTGVGLLLFAYFVNLYGQDLLTWQVALVLGIVVIGVLVIVYGVIVSYIKRR
ncbi:MAG: zinc-ribbon domain-containing protein [archaeon]|nr:zinc-ribbon domain-containing protein [archaeon]